MDVNMDDKMNPNVSGNMNGNVNMNANNRPVKKETPGFISPLVIGLCIIISCAILGGAFLKYKLSDTRTIGAGEGILRHIPRIHPRHMIRSRSRLHGLRIILRIRDLMNPIMYSQP